MHLTNGLLLSGFKKSGKDTLADFVVNHLSKEGVEVKKYALAYKLKKACALVANIPITDLDDQSIKDRILPQPLILTEDHVKLMFETFKIPLPEDALALHCGRPMESLRMLMQYGGTEVLRSTNPDIHCMKTLEVIEKEKPRFFIVSDNRFFNEIEFFNNCQKIFVNRRAVEPEVTPKLHLSERMMFEIRDQIENVDNNGTLAEFEERATKVAQEVSLFIKNNNL